MKTIVCPRCFSKHTETQLAWGCANSDCPREAVPTSNPSSKNPSCSACSQTMTMRFCPNCGFQTLVGQEAIESLPISIVGSEGAGKSNYLSVLINEIRHSVGRVYNCSLFPQGGDDTILQYENIYYRPLYEERMCIPSTDQESIRPMVYSMIFDDQNIGQTCTLTFYDACGANFRSERVMADYNRSIYNSKGVIFLVDPTQIPGLREEYIANDRQVLTDDFSSLLSRTIQLIRKGSDQKSLKNKIDIPIAICLSKLDIIKHKLDPANYLTYPSRHMQQPSYDSLEHHCCNAEVEAMLENWSGNDMMNQIKSQFNNYGFFGFSALGNPPSGDNTVTHVAPYRVCDPFLWILSQNKIIKSEHFGPKK